MTRGRWIIINQIFLAPIGLRKQNSLFNGFKNIIINIVLKYIVFHAIKMQERT